MPSVYDFVPETPIFDFFLMHKKPCYISNNLARLCISRNIFLDYILCIIFSFYFCSLTFYYCFNFWAQSAAVQHFLRNQIEKEKQTEI